MRLFGLEVKRIGDQPAENAGRVWKGGNFGYAGIMPDNSLDLFYKYYKKSVDVRRCVVELQETVAVGGYGWYDDKGEVIEKNLIGFDEMLHYGKGFGTFVKKFIRDLAIGGNVFALKLKNEAGQQIGYQFLDPRFVVIKCNEYGGILGYAQKINGHIKEYEKDDIVHFFDESDPDNEVLGLSLMEGLIIDVLTDSEAGVSNYNYFKNNAIPSSIIILEDGMSDKDKEFAVQQFKAQFSGGKNKHKISAVTGVKDIKQLQDSFADMEFTALRGFTTNKVCATFGVPKVILNYTEGVNYTNADVQYKKFIENTIRPREKKLADFIDILYSEYAAQQSGQKISANFVITDEHTSDIAERTEISIKHINNGIKTVNEVRVELGLEAYVGIEEADKPLINRGLTILEDAGLDTVTLDPNEI